MSEVWARLQESLKGTVSELHYNTWIRPTKLVSFDKNCLVVEVPNKFIRDWIYDNFLEVLQRELSEIAGSPCTLQIRLQPEDKTKGVPEAPRVDETLPVAKRQRSLVHESLIGKYTFEGFVVGAANRFAHAAAQSVAHKPGESYNPLFIYGGVGLGKTHLLNAIGNELIKRQPQAKVVCISTERFMNEFIHAVRFQKMGDFRKKYRDSCDLLLMDDIQFIAGKEMTQDEFFHTFNFLYESHKQIVVTSDKFPKEISNLEERLRSRFQWGLIADIQPPDLETRIAILKKKAEEDRIPLSDEVAMYLASRIQSNVRELEGALIRVSAFASLAGVPLGLDLAQEVLKNILGESGRLLTIEKIQRTVADHYGIRLDDLTGAKRLKGFALPRQIAMYLCRKHLRASFPQIGHQFGGKDHSTVIHAVHKIEEKIPVDGSLKNDISSLEDRLNLS
ncbi:MAG: chromosomal replication initiator protein DnaA [Deltaproteobacteria bacterium]|nr:chromosomal replication initiator protein DnaA [Deltaproteobacteria bacterium]